MFKKDTGLDEIETVIGPSVQVEGNFIANGNVVIEGTVSGSVRTEKNLKVGSEAKIFASVSADNAFIAGEIQGNVTCHGSLELASSAKIFGDIKTNMLMVATGAVLIGRCQAGDSKKARLEKIEEKEKHTKHTAKIGLESPVATAELQ